jgi:hypothetical protein
MSSFWDLNIVLDHGFTSESQSHIISLPKIFAIVRGEEIRMYRGGHLVNQNSDCIEGQALSSSSQCIVEEHAELVTYCIRFADSPQFTFVMQVNSIYELFCMSYFVRNHDLLANTLNSILVGLSQNPEN